MKNIVPDYRLDMVGEPCPYPAVATLEAMPQLKKGEILEVVSDCPQSINNIPLTTYSETQNMTVFGNNHIANKAQNFEVVAQYQFDFGLRPSVAYLQSKGKDLGAWGDQDLVEYIDVGATYYFNKNMSTFVDYKINLIDKSDFTKASGVATDDIVAVGLVYQF
ncbi:sulfurtransferase-like selenium metabolism protein YedF [Escherichia coli]